MAKQRRAADIRAASDGVDEDPIYVLYDELLRSRDRLAGLPPLTSADLAPVAQAMQEVVWYFLTPPPSAKTELRISQSAKADLLRSARDRSGDLYVTVIGALALKLGTRRRPSTVNAELEAINAGLDSLTFDTRATKKATLERLAHIRDQLDDRIAYVKGSRRKAFRFARPPELYKNRKVRSEKPERFFRRVYGADLERGLTQADIRDADPAFYNVLHVWCSRNGKRLASMVPASRNRPR
ncbi:MAG: hypothetical protein QOF14_1636 [Hyphomicrobiales bacterium]|jgi:hypothetical protein|nr:hypothetical protein [Hyphomicrobiales bacterium]